MSIKEVAKKLSTLALPMAGIQLINVASGFLCMVMLSKLGHQVLAASALIFSTQMSVMVIGMSILFSLSILIGHAYGAKNNLIIGNYMQQGWSLAVLISIVVILIFWNIKPILLLFGQLEPIAELVKVFFHAYIFAVLPNFFAVCNQQLCYGIRKQKLAMMTSSISVVILLISAYVLIFGKLGFPALGIAGLGYAMSIQLWFSFIFLTLLLYRLPSFRAFDLFTYRVHKNWSYLRQMLKIGWPMSFQMGGEMLSIFVTAGMVGWLGANALAAYQVVSQYLYLIVIPLFAFSQASGILVGHSFGAKQFSEIKTIGQGSLLVGLIIATIAAIILLLFPRHLAALYLSPENRTNQWILHWIVILFAITAVSLIFDAIKNVLTGALRGMLDTKFPMYISLVVIWLVSIPLSYCLGFIAKWGLVGIALGSGIGMLMGALAIMIRWYILMRSY